MIPIPYTKCIENTFVIFPFKLWNITPGLFFSCKILYLGSSLLFFPSLPYLLYPAFVRHIYPNINNHKPIFSFYLDRLPYYWQPDMQESHGWGLQLYWINQVICLVQKKTDLFLHTQLLFSQIFLKYLPFFLVYVVLESNLFMYYICFLL